MVMDVCSAQQIVSAIGTGTCEYVESNREV